MRVKSLPVIVMKGCPYVGASLYSLHVPSGLGGRAEFDVNKSQIFPWGLLAIEDLGPGQGVKWGFSCAQWPHHYIGNRGKSQVARGKALVGKS